MPCYNEVLRLDVQEGIRRAASYAALGNWVVMVAPDQSFFDFATIALPPNSMTAGRTTIIRGDSSKGNGRITFVGVNDSPPKPSNRERFAVCFVGWDHIDSKNAGKIERWTKLRQCGVILNVSGEGNSSVMVNVL